MYSSLYKYKYIYIYAGFLLEILGSVAGWTDPCLSQACALEPILSEVNFMSQLLRVTYVQVPWQGINFGCHSALLSDVHRLRMRRFH